MVDCGSAACASCHPLRVYVVARRRRTSVDFDDAARRCLGASAVHCHNPLPPRGRLMAAPRPMCHALRGCAVATRGARRSKERPPRPAPPPVSISRRRRVPIIPTRNPISPPLLLLVVGPPPPPRVMQPQHHHRAHVPSISCKGITPVSYASTPLGALSLSFYMHSRPQSPASLSHCCSRRAIHQSNKSERENKTRTPSSILGVRAVSLAQLRKLLA